MQRKADTSMRKRLFFVAAVLGVVCFAIVIGKLFFLQVINYEFYQARAISQQTREKTLYPVRGTIYDRNGKPLAISASTEMVTLEAVKIDDEQQGLLIAQTLTELLALPYEDVLEKVEARASYTVIQRGVEKEVADQVRAFVSEHDLDSIYLVADSTRYYPYGNFLSHVLGFVGTDEQGLWGLEFEYEDVLTGTPGRVITATNAHGEEMPFQYEMYYDAVDGNGLVLTVDEVLQHYLEKNLEIALHDNQVQNGVSGIVMDVQTGGILAMANMPDYDPNNPFTLSDLELQAEIDAMTDPEARSAALYEARNAQWRNKAVSDTYYPGSTFKIITAAIALEEGAAALSDTYNCTGSATVQGWGRPIRCWKDEGHGVQTFAQAIQNSCNPAFISIGQSIGWDTFEKYYEAFGFTEKTGIDLSGEATGQFFSQESAVNLAVLSFGQNFTITPMQLITAVSSVANGGTLVQPHFVEQIVDQDGNLIENVEPNELRQVISEDTALLMGELLESVVTVGTGKNAYTVGYRVAGKTGTTEKIADQNETGETDLRISSFVAYAPADDPQIAVLILLDEPTVAPITGGITVAPVIRRFMEEAMPYLNVEPVYTEAELAQKDTLVPNVVELSRAEAEGVLSAADLNSRTQGSGDIVTAQIPAAGALVSSGADVILYMGELPPDRTVTMPDLYGMSLEQAKLSLQNIGLYSRATGVLSTGGNSVVTKQSIEAGTAVAFGEVITLEISDLDQQAE